MIIGFAIVLATVASVLAVYLVARRVLEPQPDALTRDLASSVLFRIAALHGLVLALVFASEVAEYNALSFESSVEANAISDLYYDALRYGDEASEIPGILTSYLEVASSGEWRALGETGSLTPEGWGFWNSAYLITLDLVPGTPREEALRDNMLDKVHLIAVSRDLREHHAKTALGSMFWSAALVGVVLVSIGYYAFPPKRDNLVILTVFAGYTGLILFTIYAMSNPFSPPSALEPVLLQELLAEVTG